MTAGITKNDTAAEASDIEIAKEPPSGSALSRITTCISSESLLLSVLVGSFLLRLFVADRQSYWLDEIYAVTIHGTWNESVDALVGVLAETTVYPPAYFLALFQWMEWFGDTEFATRLLSNIFITFAALFLYLTLRMSFSRRIALTSVIAFSLMYTPTYYGIETRPYAQTILLVTASSYLLLRMMRVGLDESWKRAIVSPLGSIFVVTNAVLLLTHYYNFFFWAAQALIALIFVLCEMRPRAWLKGISVVAVLYGMQAAIFVGVWGRNFLREFGERSGPFEIAGSTELPNPGLTVFDRVISPNIRMPGMVAWVVLGLIAFVSVRAMYVLSHRRARRLERGKAWQTVYLLSWLILPTVMLYVAFSVAGVALYYDRYFVFSVAPLAPLVVLGVEQTSDYITRLVARLRGGAVPHTGFQRVCAIVLSTLVIGLLILPLGYSAVVEPKADWRGVSRDIVDIVEGNPDSDYLVYETSFRPTPLLDYYFERYDSDVRVGGTIQRMHERRAAEEADFSFPFERNADVIGQYDYLIVPFIHHSTGHFPIALDRLRESYEIQHWEVDGGGRGLAIFAVQDD
jgi:4-amino-4-deoxy-L-arabinose transferase-like glycosyltransferase